MAYPEKQDTSTQDEQLNPSNKGYKDTFQSGPAEGTSRNILDAEKNASKNDGKQLSGADKSVGDKERSTPGNNGATSIPTSYSGKNANANGKVPMSRRKKGTIASIVTVVLGIFGIGATLFTPGLGIIQMKEMLTNDLNDQLAAMDIRSDAVFKAKLKSMTSGSCGPVKIKCKFSTMSQKQIDRFKKAGFVIPDGDIKDEAFGRKRITSMTAPDGTPIKSPSDLVNARKNSPSVRSAMNRVFNPKYYGLADKVANKFFAANKTDKKKKVTGATKEEQKKSVTAIAAGEKPGGSGVLKDKEGKSYLVDEDGSKVYADVEDDKKRFAELKEASDSRTAGLDGKAKTDGKAMNSVLSSAGGGAIRGLSILGTADSACTVYNTARAVGAAAKVARSAQLIRFAMIVNGTADAIKAGDATPEEVEYVGNMLTATDTRKTIIDETTDTVKDNPFYGKSGFDSPGIKTANYNESPTLTMRSQQYMVGGGLSGTLSSTLIGVESEISKVSGGKTPRDFCKVVQSFWVRGAGLIAGVFLAIGSVGVVTVLSAAGSVAISFALPFLEAALADMIAGTVVNGDTVGVDAGDATFAGTGAMLGGIAGARGMAPASQEGIQEYTMATAGTRSDMIAQEKYEASKTPLDAMNQYSFLGTFARSLNPTVMSAKTNVASAITSVGSVINQGFASLVQPVSAKQTYNPQRFTKCNDIAYKELGIDADIFCNVRYVMTAEELGMDTEEVVDGMLAGGFIGDNGEPKGDYEEFLKNCVNRSEGWGEVAEEGGSDGKECVNDNEKTYPEISRFRVYTMDRSIQVAMDDEQEEVATEPTAPVGGNGTTVIPVSAPYRLPNISNDFGPRPLEGNEYHRGYDFFTTPESANVVAMEDGVVIDTTIGNPGCAVGGYSSYSMNNVVSIKHANGLVSEYWHMAGSSITVRSGATVKAGQVIGVISNCGWAYGKHLHFALNAQGVTDPAITALRPSTSAARGNIDPVEYYKLKGIDLIHGR